MRRRALLRSVATVALFAACGPVRTAAPSLSPTRSKPALIGVLQFGPSSASGRGFADDVATRLTELGWQEGQTFTLSFRRDLAPDRLATLAADLVAQKPDVIFAQGTFAVLAARDAAKDASIPVVFGFTGDPVIAGIVDAAELARPRGNVTGFGFQVSDSLVKAYELLRELLPKASLMGVLGVGGNAVVKNTVKLLGEAGAGAGVRFQLLELKEKSEMRPTFEAARKAGMDAVIDVANPVSNSSPDAPLGEIVVSTRMPTGHYLRQQAEAGGLLSYGPNSRESIQSAAGYVDKILRGAKVAELPVQLPATFELVINLVTAKAIGVEIPDAVISRAQAVIR